MFPKDLFDRYYLSQHKQGRGCILKSLGYFSELHCKKRSWDVKGHLELDNCQELE